MEVLQVQWSHAETMCEKGFVGRMLGGLREGLITKHSHLFSPPTSWEVPRILIENRWKNHT